LRTADGEAKLRKLTTVDFNNHNWSWLLNSDIPLVPLVIQRVPASGKVKLAPESEKSVQEESNSDCETEESTRVASQPVVNPGKRRVRGEMVPNKKKRAPAQSSRFPQPGAYALDLSIFCLWKLFLDVLFSFCRRNIGFGSMNLMMRG